VNRIDLKDSPDVPIPVSKFPIFVTAGNEGAEALLRLKSHKTEGLYTHLSHQLLKGHPQLKKAGIDLIVVPNHVSEQAEFSSLKEDSSSHLLKVTGVSHNYQREDLLKSYEAYRSSIPKASRYLLYILGGDAQQSNGKTWSYFTPEEAQKAARRVIQKLKEEPDLFLLVTNGPQTGKFDPRLGMETDAHKNTDLDAVTRAFLITLKHELPHNRFKLYNSNLAKKAPLKLC